MAPVPLVYNPAAGGGRGEGRFQRAKTRLAERGIEVAPVHTERPRHATDLVRELAEAGHDPIYVMGGDGTVSEAVNGLLQGKKRPAIGFIPGGTGNDFLRDFGCEELDPAIDRIARGKPRKVDAAQFRFEGPDGPEERFFNNILGTGFAAQAADLTNRRFKWLGKNGYSAAVVVELARLSSSPTEVVLDGKTITGDIPLVVVCNTIHTGGAMQMAPGAQVDDGLLDVVLVQDVGRLGLLRLFTQIFDGKHIQDPKVTFQRAKHIRIEPETPTPLLVDGEVFGRTPVEIEVLPGALDVLV